MFDGRLIICGGTEKFKANGLSQAWDGAKETYLFDPQTEIFQHIASDMHLGRWYPSVVTLANGKVLAISGFEAEPTISQPEIYIGARQGWTPPLSYSASASEISDMKNRLRPCADAQPQPNPPNIDLDFINDNGPPWPLYPHFFLLQDDRLFYSGGYVFANHWCFPPGWLELNETQNSFKFTPLANTLPDDFNPNRRDQSSTVILPPAHEQKIMIMGGGNQGAGDMRNDSPRMIQTNFHLS
ncbi:MAG: hypothetical protein WA364_04405 [Candidatus Nitrosopolaris sp.]